MATKHKLFKTLYEAFHARDIELALSGMHHDVPWANWMEGGSVHGRSGVRDYWMRQWPLIDPVRLGGSRAARPAFRCILSVGR